MLGADETRAKQELKDVFELEMVLANVCTAVEVLLNTEIKIFVHEDNCFIIIFLNRYLCQEKSFAIFQHFITP